MKTLPALFCIAILAGCSSVTMKAPFPESKLTAEEQKQLTGAWQLEGDQIHVAFTSNGVPWMAGVSWKDDDFVLEKNRLYVTRRDDSLYACMPIDSDETNAYLFGEIKPAGDKLIIWGPDIDYFAGRVDNGTLKGSVKKHNQSVEVALETPAAEILQLISTNHAAIDYKSPIVYEKAD